MNWFQIKTFTFFISITGFLLSQSTQTFNYTGNTQTWVVPQCVTSIDIDVAGAQGGGSNGGNGSLITGTLSVTPGQTLQINVGGQGACPGSGYNGGGAGSTASGSSNFSCGGGGASDIRVTPYQLADRIVVASGGGGMGGGNTDADGGAGGCASGISGASPFGQGGYGASSSAGGNGGPPWITSGNYGSNGSLLNGGTGASDPCYNLGPGGGGGGGYYGGGGGGSDCYSSGSLGGGGGGGGSSLTPTGTSCSSNNNNGNGYITITYTPSNLSPTATNNSPLCEGNTIQLNGTGGGSYSWSGPNGFTSSQQNPSISNSTSSNSGVYTLSVTLSGCTGTASTTVTVNPTTSSTTNLTICDDQLPYTWNGLTFNSSASQSVTLTNYLNCDSIATINLTVNPVVTSSTNLTICDDQLPYTWNGLIFNATGSLSATLSSSLGCDSIATLNLIVNPVVTSSTNLTICDDQLPYTWNGSVFNAAGSQSVTLTSSLGCDSVATLNLTVNPQVSSTTSLTICDNQLPYSWNGLTFNGAGSQSTTLVSSVGCDSIATLDLTVNPVVTSTSNITICADQLPYTWNGLTFNASANQSVILTSSLGCDSIATLNLTVNPVVTSTTNLTICDNQLPYIWNGLTFNTAGNQSATLTSAAGCDSIATLNLAVSPILTSTTNLAICDDQLPYAWNGLIFNTTSSQSVTLTSSLGCDSIATLNLTISPVVTSTTNLTICDDQLPYTWNGLIFNSTGSQSATLSTSLGCDSIATLNLTVNPLPTVTFNSNIQSSCSPLNAILTADFVSSSADYIWDIGGGISQSGSSISFTLLQPGYYDVTLSITDNGCFNSLTIPSYFYVEENPQALFTPTVNVFEELSQEVTFINSSIGATSYSWNFGNLSTSNDIDPTVFFTNTTNGYNVQLIAYSNLNCVDSLIIYIPFQESLVFYIPNTFTPDGDMFNQSFKPIFTSGFDPSQFSMKIYNRWGELIFETQNSEIGWDGSYGLNGNKVQEGVYTYHIMYKIPGVDERRIYSGHVNLIK